MPVTSESPAVEFDRDRLADWYAARHRRIDAGVERVFHLTTNAPPREIRLLEVNNLVVATTPLEPLDFGVDIHGPEGHVLNVLDITPEQWDDVEAGRLALPHGWTLDGGREIMPRVGGPDDE